MIPRQVPAELEHLTALEARLIARVDVISSITHRKSGRYNYGGHVLNIEQDLSEVVYKLPRLPRDVNFVCIKRAGANGSVRECKVRRERV